MSDQDPSEMTDEELFEAYDEVVDAGVGLGASGMSIGPAVREATPLKQEMKKRGIWGDRR